MKKYLMLALSMSYSLLFLNGCKKERITYNVPSCLQSKIDEAIKANDKNGGIKYTTYFYKNQVVYALDGGNLIQDAGETVYDSNCSLLGTINGYPSPGNPNPFEQDFKANALLISTIDVIE